MAINRSPGRPTSGVMYQRTSNGKSAMFSVSVTANILFVLLLIFWSAARMLPMHRGIRYMLLKVNVVASRPTLDHDLGGLYGQSFDLVTGQG